MFSTFSKNCRFLTLRFSSTRSHINQPNENRILDDKIISKENKTKELKRQYYFLNKDKIKEINRKYSKENKEKIKEYIREYNIQNKEKKKISNLEYREQNQERLKEYNREYYLQNKEKLKDAIRKYYVENKDKKREYDREYFIRNKDRVKEYKREYSNQNKEKMKEYDREYYVKNKEKKKESFREYYLKNKDKIKEYQIKNKDKIKQYLILKNIERNHGFYSPSNSWKTNDSIREYFKKIAPSLHISELSDWYRISRPQIIEMKGSGMFDRFNSLGEALKVAYPDYDWDLSKFSFRGKKSAQRWLYVKLKKLLPNTEIIEEYNHPELLWEENAKKSMQLDIWISEYKLALEYQGEHHYFDIPNAYGPGSTTQLFNERDEKKKQLCASKGIRLVCIPYWWDGHEDSLSSTLHTILPDVFHKTDSLPISDIAPTDYIKVKKKSLDVRCKVADSKENNRKKELIKEKRKEYLREYYIQNKNKMKEFYREYRIQNKEKIKDYEKEYRILNKSKKKEYDKEYSIRNKAKIQEYLQEYRNQNQDKVKEYNQIYNKDKKKKSRQEYYLENRDKLKEYNKEYSIRNKDRIKEYSNHYFLQNKEKKKEINREYRIQNKDKIKEYQIKNKDKMKQYFIQKMIEKNNGKYEPLNSWKTNESVREYFEKIGPLLHINDLSDWYRISRSQIDSMKGSGMFYRFNSFGEALKVAYPDYDWDMSKFSLRGKKSIQRWLYVKLKKLLPNSTLVEDYHHPDILWEESTNKPIQLDIWVPEYNLALEYQGEHHYFDIPGAFGPGSTTKLFNERDEKKKQLSASKGIHLVCIPYWWDGHEDSLSSTLHKILPDVFYKTNSPPIPDNANLPTTDKEIY